MEFSHALISFIEMNLVLSVNDVSLLVCPMALKEITIAITVSIFFICLFYYLLIDSKYRKVLV
jgi:hypothetical protein